MGKYLDKWARISGFGNGQDLGAELREAGARPAEDVNPHGLPPEYLAEMRRRMAAFEPTLIGGEAGQAAMRLAMLKDVLPPGATPALGGNETKTASLYDMAKQAQSLELGQSSGSTLYHNMKPYQPELEDPSRQMMPTSRTLWNRYARLFYKVDAVIPTVIDMLSDLAFSEFTLSGEGVEGSIKNLMEAAVDESGVFEKLPAMSREFLMLGEAPVHLYFDDAKGHWTYCTIHDPDHIEVIHTPFIPMEPVAEWRPDPVMRRVLTMQHPMLRAVRESLPQEFVGRILSGKNITLSPGNFTFLARKLHDYELRGTSILSRLWRILMFEDCYVAGTPVALADGTTRPIEDVVAGDAVLDRHGRRAVVEAAVQKESGGTLRRIKLRGGTSFTVTPTHKFPVWAYPRVCQCGCGEPVKDGSSYVGLHVSRWGALPEWTSYGEGSGERWDMRRVPKSYNPVQKLEAGDLRVGDYLMVPRTFDVEDTDVSESYARLLGYYVAEGSVRPLSGGKIGLQFSFHERERDTWAADCCSILAEHGVRASIVSGGAGRHAISVTTTQHAGDEFCREIVRLGGRYSAKKVLAAAVMKWPVRLKRAFMTGYLRGDGSVLTRAQPTCSVTVSCATVSENLADQLWLLFAQIGWPCSRRLTRPSTKDGRNRLPRHDFAVKGRWADDLISVVWGTRPARSADANPTSAFWIDDDWVYYPIKSIEDIASDQPVYGLTVSGDHSYVAAGVATYNSLFNAAIATARRRAAPLKVVRIGSQDGSFMPPPEYGEKLIRMIAQTEMDPMSWIAVLNAVQFELVGVQEQVMSINAHYDLIERVKLSALGVSKALINGEANYSASAAGLTILMQRLQQIRTYFMKKWLIPKFFRVMAEVNEWYQPTAAEVSHNVRVKRSKSEAQGRLIVPNIEWSKALDSKVDADRAGVIQQLENSGLIFSKRTKFATMGIDRDDEWKQIKQEVAEAKSLAGDDMDLLGRLGYAPGSAAAPADGGMGGGGGAPAMLPPMAPGSFGDFGPEQTPPGQEPVAPGPAPAAGLGIDATDSAEAADLAAAGWEASAVSAGKRLLQTFDPADAIDSDPWSQVLKSQAVLSALETGDPEHAWRAIERWLVDRAYPADVIVSLGQKLVPGARIEHEARQILKALEEDGGLDTLYSGTLK